MHRLVRKKWNSDAALVLVAFWCIAPFSALLPPLFAGMLGVPVKGQGWIMNSLIAAILLVMTPLAVIGSAQIRKWLETNPYIGVDVFRALTAAFLFAALAAWVSKAVVGVVARTYGEDMGFRYAIFLGVWAAAIALQLKWFADHTLKLWEAQGVRIFVGDMPRFSATSRRIAGKLLAERRARVWLAKTKTRMSSQDDMAFAAWRGLKANRQALDRVTPGYLIRLIYRWPFWVLSGLIAARLIYVVFDQLS